MLVERIMETTGHSTPSLIVLWNKLWDEIRNFKKFFNVTDFTEAIFLKVLLPFNDIVSDFLVAENGMYRCVECDPLNPIRWSSAFIYFVIAFPGVMIAVSNIWFFKDRLCSRRFQGFALIFILVILFPMELFVFTFGNPTYIFPLAIFVSTCILCVGVMDIFFHGPIMKRISLCVIGYEGIFESGPELFLQLLILMARQEYSETSFLDVYSMCTSLVMLSKDLAVNILSNCQNKPLLNKSFTGKMFELRKIFPVIMLTSIFRIGTLALAVHHIFVVNAMHFLIPLKLIIFLPPTFTLLWLHSCNYTKLI